MSVNSSNSSLLPHPPFSSLDPYDFAYKCFTSTTGLVSATTFTITGIIILLPLCVFVLYLGHQRWRQQRSGTVMSHSDVFTYHMVVIELMNIFGSILTCFGALPELPKMITAAGCLFNINTSGQMLFHILTCLERYLAVVHPVTYLNLKKANGIRIRNITIGCVWLLCFASSGLMFIKNSTTATIMSLFVTALALITMCFCSLSVLWVLIRPGPGEGGGSRQQVHQSKLRAFYIIMAIFGVLFLKFGQNMVGTSLGASGQLGETGMCDLLLSAPWFSLPSSLVLPLLFLHRAGKLPCYKSNTQSGQGSD